MLVFGGFWIGHWESSPADELSLPADKKTPFLRLGSQQPLTSVQACKQEFAGRSHTNPLFTLPCQTKRTFAMVGKCWYSQIIKEGRTVALRI